MTPAEARRSAILDALARADAPLSGAELGRICGVSRQVVVQDVALLRERGKKVASTPRGYVLEEAPAPAARPQRLFKCHHSIAQTADELRLIVDLGARVEDVFVNHRVYGQLSSELGIACRRDVDRFMADLAGGRSEPLMQVTGGYHFHHVSADDEAVLDEVERALEDAGFLVPLSDYEREAFGTV